MSSGMQQSAQVDLISSFEPKYTNTFTESDRVATLSTWGRELYVPAISCYIPVLGMIQSAGHKEGTSLH